MTSSCARVAVTRNGSGNCGCSARRAGHHGNCRHEAGRRGRWRRVSSVRRNGYAGRGRNDAASGGKPIRVATKHGHVIDTSVQMIICTLRWRRMFVDDIFRVPEIFWYMCNSSIGSFKLKSWSGSVFTRFTMRKFNACMLLFDLLFYVFCVCYLETTLTDCKYLWVHSLLGLKIAAIPSSCSNGVMLMKCYRQHIVLRDCKVLTL